VVKIFGLRLGPFIGIGVLVMVFVISAIASEEIVNFWNSHVRSDDTPSEAVLLSYDEHQPVNEYVDGNFDEVVVAPGTEREKWISEGVVVAEGSTHTDEETLFRFGVINIRSTSIDANTTVYGSHTVRRSFMSVGDVISYTFDGRRFSFLLESINSDERYVTITIRESVSN